MSSNLDLLIRIRCLHAIGEIHALLLEDPYTRRAFTKPRGYAGDATTLDFVYGHAEVWDAVVGCSEIGRMIYAYTGGASLAANAVRWRCTEIARRIEAIAATHRTARVLAFACGHLREIELVHHHLRPHMRITAADIDEESLRLVENAYGQAVEIESRRVSVKDLITGRQEFEPGFNLIYTLGLCDYLSEKVAQRLVAMLLALAAPGGEVVVANFTLSTKGRAYMEAAMDWRLQYRNADDLAEWARLAGGDVAAEVFEDPFGQVAYLVLRKPM